MAMIGQMNTTTRVDLVHVVSRADHLEPCVIHSREFTRVKLGFPNMHMRFPRWDRHPMQGSERAGSARARRAR